MAVVRLDLDSDATWQRAWVIDTLAELATFALTYTTPFGPKRGDIVLCNEDNFFYLFVGNNNYKQVSGYAVLPIQLNSDVTGVLPVANGGLGLNTAVQGNIIYSDAADSYQRLAKDTNATRYLANTGTSNGPAWDQVNLANGVTGILPAANFPVWQNHAFNAGDYTANGSMTWTVASATVNRYMILGTTFFWNVSVSGTVGGTPSTELQIAVPAGKAAAIYADFRLSYVEDNGAVTDGFVYSSGAGDDKLGIGLMSLGNWSAGVATLDFNIALEIQ